MRSGWYCLLLLIAHYGAQAQIFVCKDATGRTVSADRPIPECANRPVRELSRTGVTVREIEPPPTPEQKRQLQLLAEQRKVEEAAAAEQRKSDQLLRLRYYSENDIGLARQRALGILQEQMKNDVAMLALAEKQLQTVQGEIESQRKKNPALTPVAQRKLDDANDAVKSAQRNKNEREAEIQKTNLRFDETLKRYRELTTGERPAAGKAASAAQ